MKQKTPVNVNYELMALVLTVGPFVVLFVVGLVLWAFGVFP